MLVWHWLLQQYFLQHKKEAQEQDKTTQGRTFNSGVRFLYWEFCLCAGFDAKIL